MHQRTVGCILLSNELNYEEVQMADQDEKKSTSNSKQATVKDKISVLEKQLDTVLVKNAPFQLPKEAKDWLVKYAPLFAVITGFISILLALGLWQLTRATNIAIDYLNSVSQQVGQGSVARKLGLFWYLALASLIVQSIMQFVAYSGLRDRKKMGWNWLFYSALVSVVVGIFYIFIQDRGVLSFIWNLITAIISLYLLFQIRSYYTNKKQSN